MKPKNMMVALASALVVSTSAVRAEEAAPVAVAEVPAKEWSVEAGFDYFSQYIFRGFQISDETLLMPHALAKWKWFTASYYGYFSEFDAAPGNKWYGENDFTFDATLTVGKFALSAGTIYYNYPDSSDGLDTWEVYGAVAYNFPLLNPKLTLYWDVDAFQTGYLTLGINHPFDLTAQCKLPEGWALSVTPSAQLGVWFKKNGDPVWNDVLLGVSANLAFNKYISFHTGVQLSVALDNVRDAGHKDEVIANVGLTFTY